MFILRSTAWTFSCFVLMFSPRGTGIRRLTLLRILQRWSMLPCIGFGFVEFVLVSCFARSGLVSFLHVNGLEVLGFGAVSFSHVCMGESA